MSYSAIKRRERYLKNRERDIEYGKRYYKDNIDRMKAVKRQYYMANRERIIKKSIVNRKARMSKGQNVTIKTIEFPNVCQNVTEK